VFLFFLFFLQSDFLGWLFVTLAFSFSFLVGESLFFFAVSFGRKTSYSCVDRSSFPLLILPGTAPSPSSIPAFFPGFHVEQGFLPAQKRTLIVPLEGLFAFLLPFRVVKKVFGFCVDSRPFPLYASPPINLTRRETFSSLLPSLVRPSIPLQEMLPLRNGRTGALYPFYYFFFLRGKSIPPLGLPSSNLNYGLLSFFPATGDLFPRCRSGFHSPSSSPPAIGEDATSFPPFRDKIRFSPFPGNRQEALPRERPLGFPP